MALRTYTMSNEDRMNFNPRKFVEDMKAAGFIFESESCPVKIKHPWDSVRSPEGVVVFRQWDSANDHLTGKLEDWEEAVFRNASHFQIVNYRQNKSMVRLNFHMALQEAGGDPENMIYAINPDDRFFCIPRAQWPKYLEIWKNRHVRAEL